MIGLGARDQSLTMRLSQWDLLKDVIVSEDGALEAGIEIQIPPTTLLPTSAAEALHLGWMATLRNALPQNERLRLYIEASPFGEKLIHEYEGGTASDHPQARALTKRKVAALMHMRQRGQLVQYRAYLLFTTSPKRKRKKRQAYLRDEFPSRSEEHTSELQSRPHLVCRLLLE